MTLSDLAILFRGLQLFAHNAHHLAKGVSFFEDHEFLGETYQAYESAYDSVIELIIGDGGTVDLLSVQADAVSVLNDLSGESFPVLYRGEEQIQKAVDEIAAGTKDQGVIQVIGTIAQDSKVRRYKIGQRIS